MISSGSLSAFSASVTSGSLNGPVNGAASVQKASAQRAQPQPAAPAQALATRPQPQVSPGQIMPRGSLLDLSV